MSETATILHIDPDLSFPIGEPFEVPDLYNGTRRGTWYFRSPFTGFLYGPYMNQVQATFYMNQDNDCA